MDGYDTWTTCDRCDAPGPCRPVAGDMVCDSCDRSSSPGAGDAYVVDPRETGGYYGVTAVALPSPVADEHSGEARAQGLVYVELLGGPARGRRAWVPRNNLRPIGGRA